MASGRCQDIKQDLEKPMKSPLLRLKIELVPKTCFGANLRQKLSRSQWDKIRTKAYADQGNVCKICGSDKRLNCHEIWAFDEENHLQKLLGFEAVCGMCHHVIHYGRSQQLAETGQLDLAAVEAHFLKVNGVDRMTFEAHKTEAFQIWRERSKHEWTTDFGEWALLLLKKKG